MTTETKKVTEHLFGHCAYGSPDLDKHECKGEFQRFIIGPVGKGRRKTDGVILLDEWYKCTCLCHVPEADRPKPKRTRKKKS